MYLRKNYPICYELSQITKSNLRAFYEFFFFTDCYEYITECYYSSKFLRVSYDLFTCCYEQLRVSYEYLRVLTIFLQKTIYIGAVAVAAPSSEASFLEIEEIMQLNLDPFIIGRI